ncbi:hypothetical protein ACFV9C_28280 [Kribbella sp. NPDC059898]|uniref:hypothetical protein n=1 Tax=Kribbella sp. NPDC059898 TaxID=3346995 RepID=UPI003667A6FF
MLRRRLLRGLWLRVSTLCARLSAPRLLARGWLWRARLLLLAPRLLARFLCPGLLLAVRPLRTRLPTTRVLTTRLLRTRGLTSGSTRLLQTRLLTTRRLTTRLLAACLLGSWSGWLGCAGVLAACLLSRRSGWSARLLRAQVLAA